MASFLGSNFGFEFGAKICLFLEFVAGTVVAVAVRWCCAPMLKNFPRPSFLDCTRGSIKPFKS